MDGTRVVVSNRPGLRYPMAAPFAPPNPVYELIETTLRRLGLDVARAGTPDWNPLGDLVATGGRVVVKTTLYSATIATPGALVRPIIDYARRAVGPSGTVAIVDAPHPRLDFAAIVEATGLGALRSPAVALRDLRLSREVERMAVENVRRFGRALNLGVVLREKLAGDPEGYAEVELRERSAFADVRRREKRLCSDGTRRAAPRLRHRDGRHLYGVPRTLLAADLVIDVAKLCTHDQVGVAGALASALGWSDERAQLACFTAGSPDEDGDEYAEAPPLATQLEHRLRRSSVRVSARRVGSRPGIREGRWDGNDTLWRSAHDLATVLYYADRDGLVREAPQRRVLAIVDSLVGGDGEGPREASPRPAGILVAGFDSALVDVVATRTMGYSEDSVPIVHRALAGRGRALLPTSDRTAMTIDLDGPEPDGAFTPPLYWGALLRRPRGWR